MRPTRFAAASLFAVLVSLSLVPPAAAECLGVLATANTTWIDDSGVEVGKAQGFINGAFYLNHHDDTEPTEDRHPNLVIVTDQGELRVWASGKSDLREDGSWGRYLITERAEGTGSFAGSSIVIELAGTFEPGAGGRYRLSGTICPPEIGPRR